MALGDNLFKPGTIVRLKKTGEFARIKNVVCLKDQTSFLHYEGEIEGREEGALWAMYPGDIELECLPPEETQGASK